MMGARNVRSWVKLPKRGWMGGLFLDVRITLKLSHPGQANRPVGLNSGPPCRRASGRARAPAGTRWSGHAQQVGGKGHGGARSTGQPTNQALETHPTVSVFCYSRNDLAGLRLTRAETRRPMRALSTGGRPSSPPPTNASSRPAKLSWMGHPI